MTAPRCEWHDDQEARCIRPAVGLVNGQVPICERCATWLRLRVELYGNVQPPLASPDWRTP